MRRISGTGRGTAPCRQRCRRRACNAGRLVELTRSWRTVATRRALLATSTSDREISRPDKVVMRGLDPRIHREKGVYSRMMDCRVKPGNDKQKGRHRCRTFARYDFASSLRRELDLGGGGADIGVDLGFELGKILLEHADQRARGLVELALVLPGFDRVENLARHTRQRGWHREA